MLLCYIGLVWLCYECNLYYMKVMTAFYSPYFLSPYLLLTSLHTIISLQIICVTESLIQFEM